MTELSQAAQIRLPDLEWQQLTGEKVFLPEPGSSTGGARSMADAFQSASRSGIEADSFVRVPIGMTGELVRAGQRPLAGFSCGGAHHTGSVSAVPTVPIDDFTTTDGELGMCIGLCETGHCAGGGRCSLKLKRKRPVVRAPAADLAVGTFKRPTLFRKGDAVEFVAPDRRIKVRTFGTIESVHHVGAQPHYTVVSAKGTIYSFSEDCLRSRGPSDDNFALQDSTLVTIGDLSTTNTVLTLDSVDEAVEDVDEDFLEAEAGQASAEDAAAAAVEELSRAQSAVLMASFDARLQERDAAVQEQLRSQLEALVSKQELAHERMLLMLSSQRSVASDAGEQQPVAAAATPVDVNPRLVSPVADDFTTPAAREVPMQELMTSPLQALRSGALAMAGTQRRTSFGKVFDLNSSGGTAASSSPAMTDQESKSSKPLAAAAKDDESYVAEYYARAQLANAKMVRQYKTRIEELKRSSFPSVMHGLKVIMHTGGKVIGFTSRRLSWAEICLIALLLQQFAPFARPYMAPLLRAIRATVIDYLLAVKQNSVASLRAAVATGLAGLTALVSQRSATHAQELVEQREMISAQLIILKEQLAQAQAASAAAAPAVTDASSPPPVDKLVLAVGNISAAVLSIHMQGSVLAGTLVYQPGPRSGGRRAWVQDWWVGVADCDWPLANVPGHACVISVRSETVPEHVGPFGVLSVGPSLVCN